MNMRVSITTIPAPETQTTSNEGSSAMWDTVETTRDHLSHDMPCPGCGHAAHRFLSCSDSCGCVPPPAPGVYDVSYSAA